MLLLRYGRPVRRGFVNEYAAAAYAFALAELDEGANESDSRALFWCRLSFTRDDDGANSPYDATYGFSLQSREACDVPLAAPKHTFLDYDSLCRWSFCLTSRNGVSRKFRSASDAARRLCLQKKTPSARRLITRKLVLSIVRRTGVCGHTARVVY